MKALVISAAAFAAFAVNPAHAEEQKPDNEFTFNAAVVSDYRYRGISQTRLDPALQAGADYTHNPSGFYAGTWLSTIHWIKDAGGDGNVEWDIYGGKRGEFGGGVSYDVGVLTYVYPSNKLHPNADTTEVYAQVGYGPAYLKYSYALTNLFGFADSQGSGYLDAGANIDIGRGVTLNLHAGHQDVTGNSGGFGNGRFSYADWKVGVTKDFGIANGSVAWVGTNAERNSYTSLANGKFLGKNALVFSLAKTF